ncbi:MAG: PIG-L family deacetylase [Oscillospiraceae bacterium]|nr:PIG-L family deacetylase [Oscillospiraceae bacterium]
MKFHNPNAITYVPDDTAVADALQRTTSLCFAAHQDDIELMAYSAVAECFDSDEKWFGGVIVTNGAGALTEGVYEGYTTEQMIETRVREANQASSIGRYSFQIQLLYPSSEIKQAGSANVLEDMAAIIKACRAEKVFTHNLADKHPSHAAVALRTIEAIRRLPKDLRPRKLYGMAAWRDLDWVTDDLKVVFDASAHPNIAMALISLYDSQIAGSKRYDLAAEGRRRANSVLHSTHGLNVGEAVDFAIDMTALVEDDELSPKDYMISYVDALKREIASTIDALS